MVTKAEEIDPVDKTAADMQRQFGTPYLKCVEGCQRAEYGSWGYLRSGWPKCCGYTMRLITDRGEAADG